MCCRLYSNRLSNCDDDNDEEEGKSTSVVDVCAKLKVRSGACAACVYMSETRVQKRFTISEAAADWHSALYAVIH